VKKLTQRPALDWSRTLTPPAPEAGSQGDAASSMPQVPHSSTSIWAVPRNGRCSDASVSGAMAPVTPGRRREKEKDPVLGGRAARARVTHRAALVDDAPLGLGSRTPPRNFPALGTPPLIPHIYKPPCPPCR